MRNVLFCVLVISANHQTRAQAITASAPRHALAISAPRPDYPLEARSHWLEGRGLFSLTIRPDGTVESVEIGKSTGHARLDQSAIVAFRKWRFKPSRVRHIKIPMEFTMAGLRPQGIDSAGRKARQPASFWICELARLLAEVHPIVEWIPPF